MDEQTPTVPEETTPAAEPEVVEKRTLRLSKVQKTMDVELDDGKGGVELCTLREMFGDDKDAWSNFMNDRAKLNSAGEAVGLKNHAGVESELITKCLYNAQGKQIPKSIISKFPASTISALFDACLSLNSLTKKAKDEAKKV